jgi:hypothetical protein
MSPRQLLVLGVLAAGSIAGALYWSRSEQPVGIQAQSLIFPGLQQRQERIDGIRVLGAGNAPLVSLKKQAGVWRVLERKGWPADAGKVSQTLFLLAQARLLETRTAEPAQYAKIGVEGLNDRWAQGMEVRLEGGGPPLRVLIGHAHLNQDGNYVRVGDAKQSWLSDRLLDISRDPVQWLDHHLIDRPLARTEQVQVDSADGNSYQLAFRDDRFRLVGIPSAAMHDSHAGDAMAGFLDQLNFDDVADDDGTALAERKVRFLGVDGVSVEVGTWRDQGKVWIRLAAALDEARLERWLTDTGKTSAKERTDATNKLREQVGAWQSRFSGKRFLLPSFKAAILLMSREQILKGEE